MLHVDHAACGQSVADLRRLATTAAHPRSRERYLALYDIARGSCASQVAARTGRHPQTVLDWVHAYNARGPEALVYRRTGGRPPFVAKSRPPCGGKSAMRSSRPSAHP
jgi:Homeodomain-like domain